MDTTQAALRTCRMFETETVVWLSTVRQDGAPHMLPIWFSWDGETILIASKPHARKVANLRLNPRVMLAVGEPADDFDVGLVEGVAEILDSPAANVLPPAHLAKYRDRMAEIGLTADEFLATYSLVIRVRPTRFLPWHGRTEPTGVRAFGPIDRRIAAAVRRVSVSVAATRQNARALAPWPKEAGGPNPDRSDRPSPIRGLGRADQHGYSAHDGEAGEAYTGPGVARDPDPSPARAIQR
jgi:PPOX class probable F420-dependent enzyme